MKTTLELPDELMRAVKMRAASENRRLKDLIEELIRRGLHQAAEAPAGGPRRVQLPLVQCGRPASPEEEMMPERTAAILLSQEVSAEREASAEHKAS